MSAVPPVNPPEADLYDCDTCGGTGQIVHHDGPLGPLVAVVEWCTPCDGRGVREYDDPDQGQPDHWKDTM